MCGRIQALFGAGTGIITTASIATIT